MITICLSRHCELSHTPYVSLGERVVVSLALLGRPGLRYLCLQIPVA